MLFLSLSYRGPSISLLCLRKGWVHSLPWNEVNYVYDFGFIPMASHGVNA
ncbi:MAG: hypothetical protein Q8O30_05795 [Candidatus Omnitrophota bacterium]|nr:hypothetical protein [Candidatus Omnitrophota bacterium]